jgi:predicted transcriptional regulator
MLKRGKPVQNSMIFRVPFGCTLPWHEFVRQYPLILDCMDGIDRTCTLEFYYSCNPLNGIYEFESEDAENDIADMIGISFAIVSNGESKEDEDTRKQLETENGASNLFSNSVSEKTADFPTEVLLQSSNLLSTNEEEKKRKHQRELFAFLHIENEKEREVFLSSELTEEEYLLYSNEETTTTVESESNENGKRCKKSAKKERRRQKVTSRENLPALSKQGDDKV